PSRRSCSKAGSRCRSSPSTRPPTGPAPDHHRRGPPGPVPGGPRTVSATTPAGRRDLIPAGPPWSLWPDGALVNLGGDRDLRGYLDHAGAWVGPGRRGARGRKGEGEEMDGVTPDSAETQRLLEELRAGDGRAFGQLFARHRPYLRALVALRLDPRLRP